MTFEPENPRPSGQDDPLDRLLREARWPEPIESAEARLTQHWQKAWSARRRQMLLLRRAAGLAIAATILVAAALGWKLTHRDVPITDDAERPIDSSKTEPSQKRPSPTQPRHKSESVGVRQPRVPRATFQVSIPTPAGTPDFSAISRPPNQLEELMLAALDRQAAHRATPSKPRPAKADLPVAAHEQRRVPNASPKVTPEKRRLTIVRAAQEKRALKRDAAVQAAVDRLVKNPQSSASEAIAPLRSSPADYEPLLLARLDRPDTRERIAALRLLGEIGSPITVPYLLRAADDSSLHAAAVEAVARLADSSIVAELANREPDSSLQRTLLASLLMRGDAQSVQSYLTFVRNDATAENAIAAAGQAQNPPMELLFAALEDRLETTRIAAARVIGRIDGPAATRRLIAMVEQETSRQEAWVALLSSRGDDAQRFVTESQNDPARSGSLRAASLFIPKSISPRS